MSRVKWFAIVAVLGFFVSGLLSGSASGQVSAMEITFPANGAAELEVPFTVSGRLDPSLDWVADEAGAPYYSVDLGSDHGAAGPLVWDADGNFTILIDVPVPAYGGFSGKRIDISVDGSHLVDGAWVDEQASHRADLSRDQVDTIAPTYMWNLPAERPLPSRFTLAGGFLDARLDYGYIEITDAEGSLLASNYTNEDGVFAIDFDVFEWAAENAAPVVSPVTFEVYAVDKSNRELHEFLTIAVEDVDPPVASFVLDTHPGADVAFTGYPFEMTGSVDAPIALDEATFSLTNSHGRSVDFGDLTVDADDNWVVLLDPTAADLAPEDAQVEVRLHATDVWGRVVNESFIILLPDGPTCAGLPVTVDWSAGERPTDGDDVIMGTASRDRIRAGDGNDVICGLEGGDVIFGERGRDLIFSGRGRDRVRAGIGADEVHAGPGNDRVKLGGGDDTAYGVGGDDTIHGFGGNDWIHGGGGADLLYGGDGNDVLHGGSGVNGGSGDAGTDQCALPFSSCEELAR